MSIIIINWTSGGMRPEVVGGEGEAPSEPALALGSDGSLALARWKVGLDSLK